MGRKVLPMEITQQVSSVISALDNNREVLFSIIPDVSSFCNSESLHGDTWSKAKSYMGNHILVIQTLIVTIDYFKRICNVLVTKCGTEDLDEEVLNEQKASLKRELVYYVTELNALDTTCPIDEKDIRYAVSELYYESTLTKKTYYSSMITSLETQIQYIDGQINKIDEIDTATQNINDYVEELQMVVEEGIEYLTASLSDDGFVFPFGYSDSWKEKSEKLWNLLDQINNYDQGVLFDDQMKIEASKTNGKMYFTFDRSGIIYNGQIYEIYVPPQDGNTYIDVKYTTVKEKEAYDISFSFSKALFGVDLEDPDFQSVNTSTQTLFNPHMTNSYAAGIILDGLIGGVEAGLGKVDIKVTLQESTDGKSRRAMIAMGSYEDRMLENKLNYGVEMSMQLAYGLQVNSQEDISNEAFGIYNSLSGGDKTQGSYVYDYVAEFSEGRLNDYYNAYLSFDTNGNIVVTPFRYEGEKVTIVRYDNAMLSNRKEVMDISDIVFGSYTISSEECLSVIGSIVSDSIY